MTPSTMSDADLKARLRGGVSLEEGTAIWRELLFRGANLADVEGGEIFRCAEGGEHAVPCG